MSLGGRTLTASAELYNLAAKREAPPVSSSTQFGSARSSSVRFGSIWQRTDRATRETIGCEKSAEKDCTNAIETLLARRSPESLPAERLSWRTTTIRDVARLMRADRFAAPVRRPELRRRHQAASGAHKATDSYLRPETTCWSRRSAHRKLAGPSFEKMDSLPPPTANLHLNEHVVAQIHTSRPAIVWTLNCSCVLLTIGSDPSVRLHATSGGRLQPTIDRAHKLSICQRRSRWSKQQHQQVIRINYGWLTSVGGEWQRFFTRSTRGRSSRGRSEANNARELRNSAPFAGCVRFADECKPLSGWSLRAGRQVEPTIHLGRAARTKPNDGSTSHFCCCLRFSWCSAPCSSRPAHTMARTDSMRKGLEVGSGCRALSRQLSG